MSHFSKRRKFKNKTAWKTLGIDTWRSAIGKIKEHASTEAHVMSMVRWNIYSKKALQAAFDTSDIQGKATQERERQTNREILRRFIEIFLYLAQRASFRGDGESSLSVNQGNFIELVKTLAQYDSVMKLQLDAIQEKQASMK